MKHLLFTNSVEWGAYYDYWVAVMTLSARNRMREQKNPDHALIIEKGLLAAALAKAKYKLLTEQTKSPKV